MEIMIMPKKVIITGVTGQDGSYMADFLLKETDCEIYGIVRRASTNNQKNIQHLLENPRVKFLTGDLTDSQSIDNIIRDIQPDYFINFAAQSFVTASWQIPEQTFDIDAIGVIRCLEGIRKHVPNCRFYNAGSSEEFGDVDYSPQDNEHPLKPRSPYGAAKAAARHIVKVYRESYNLFAIQGLLYNHESPRRGEEFVTRKITKQVAKIKKAIDYKYPFSPLELGNIYSERDWSHSKDFIEGIWLMLNKNEPKEYILASGETHTVKEFVKLAFSIANINGEWVGENLNEKFIYNNLELVIINPNLYRPAEVSTLLGDPSTAKLELKWRLNTTFYDLVKEMVEYDIKNIN